MRHPDLVEIVEPTRRFFRWLRDQALPLWSTKGVDAENGGFIERLTPDGCLIADIRRARLVARQIFAFKAAGDLGWNGPVAVLVRHGIAALLERHLTAQNGVVSLYIPGQSRGEETFDLYDHAFVLFGLAHGYAQTGATELETLALAILSRMRNERALKNRGFGEHRPPQAPLKANPHMHLLEASLAWREVSTDAAWRELAAEMVQLCLSRFIGPDSGAVHEFFDVDWSILRGEDDVVEPGHQAEWAWLLLRYSDASPYPPLQSATARLLQIAEGQGLDRSQHRLINELNADLSARDGRARLWPQTERIKALVSIHEREPDEHRRSQLLRRLAQSIEALLGYFDHPIAGSWWEHFDHNGDRIVEPARASSLYHIIGAANELARVTGERLH